MIDHLIGAAFGVAFVLALGYGLSRSDKHYRALDGRKASQEKKDR